MRVPKLPLALLCLGAASPAYAHFKLMQPRSWANQSELYGDPQKTPPCGNEGAVPTGMVTEYKVGDMVPIIVTETIYHPGHYRVALAATQGALPPAPPVTQVGNDPCGSTQITPNPTLPILADGLLAHAAPFQGSQTMSVQLPPGMTCDSCVLQVLEYMSNHSAPCFYYHCANIKITETGPVGGPGGGGGGGGDDGGVDPGGGGAGTIGGGCTAGGPSSIALALGLLALRRRRR
jgi:uncharacterized protein (TIGR03382 family)